MRNFFLVERLRQLKRPRGGEGVADVGGALQSRQVVEQRRALFDGLLLDFRDRPLFAFDLARDGLGVFPFVEAAPRLVEPEAAVRPRRRAEVRGDLEVIRGDEVRDFEVAPDDEREGRRLHPAERVDALMARAARAEGLRARGVDADEPVGALARVRRVAEPRVLARGLQRAEPFEDGVSGER